MLAEGAPGRAEDHGPCRHGFREAFVARRAAAQQIIVADGESAHCRSRVTVRSSIIAVMAASPSMSSG